MAEKSKGKIKVRVTIVVEVDRDAYDAEFGEDASAQDVRDFVKFGVTGEFDAAQERYGDRQFARIVSFK